MRIKVVLAPVNGTLVLPLHYQSILQGVIYHSLNRDKDFQAFLHDEGYEYEKRQFKLFTFSRLFGRKNIHLHNRTIEFHGPVTWYIGSVLPEFIQYLGQRFLFDDEVMFGSQKMETIDLYYEKESSIEESCIRIKMISPITVYSTYQKEDGKRITHYFRPEDLLFSHLVSQNSVKKYEAYYDGKAEKKVNIRPIRVKESDKVVTRFKQTLITAWSGEYELSASPDMLRFLYSVGLGAKNSQGFGMFQVLHF